MDDPIIFKRTDERITLDMSVSDYEYMLWIFGLCGGTLSAGTNSNFFWNLIKFVNKLNAGNDWFTEYQIPEEYR